MRTDSQGSTRLRGRHLAFAGGGTGGHIVPGLHLLDYLVAAGAPPAAVTWLHGGRAVEREVLADLEQRAGGARVDRIPLPLEAVGGGAPALGGLALRLPRATRRARRALVGADLLLALGGYTSAPAVLAARSLGIPSVLLEINAVRGRATRALTPLCRRVLPAWPASLPAHPGPRHRLVGPPVGPRFRPVTGEGRREARRRLGLELGRPLLLVLGGSQGAGALNTFISRHLTLLLGSGLGILHQVGPGRLEEAGSAASGYRGVEYLHDVPTALEAASLVLCRGGASTLAEVAAMRVPAWVVPYPHHSDAHQVRNAEFLGRGVRIVPEQELGTGLARELAQYLGPEGHASRVRMRAALGRSAPRDSARRLANELGQLIGTPVKV